MREVLVSRDARCTHDVADACRLAMSDVRVRLPLGAWSDEATPSADGPLDAPVEQWQVHHPVKVEARVQFPSGALGFWFLDCGFAFLVLQPETSNEKRFVWHGTPTGRAAELKPRKVWVRLPPVLWISRRVLGDRAVCNTAAPVAWGVRFPHGA